jgi:quercetin dioxygenase-like cupin family protein
MDYVMVTGDGADGSRFVDVQLEQVVTSYTANVPPLRVSEEFPTTGVVFATMAEVRETDWHPPPHRQFVVIVEGELEIETTDGAKRRFPPGAVVLVEDLAGRGHKTTASSPGPATWMGIPLTD